MKKETTENTDIIEEVITAGTETAETAVSEEDVKKPAKKKSSSRKKSVKKTEEAPAAEDAVSEASAAEANQTEVPAEDPKEEVPFEVPAETPAAENPAEVPAEKLPGEAPVAEAPSDIPAAEAPAEELRPEVPAAEAKPVIPEEKAAADEPADKPEPQKKPAKKPAQKKKMPARREDPIDDEIPEVLISDEYTEDSNSVEQEAVSSKEQDKNPLSPEMLDKLVEFGRAHNSILEIDDINNFFKGIVLSPEQIEHIISFLERKKIDVLRIMNDDLLLDVDFVDDDLLDASLYRFHAAIDLGDHPAVDRTVALQLLYFLGR